MVRRIREADKSVEAIRDFFMLDRSLALRFKRLGAWAASSEDKLIRRQFVS